MPTILLCEDLYNPPYANDRYSAPDKISTLRSAIWRGMAFCGFVCACVCFGDAVRGPPIGRSCFSVNPIFPFVGGHAFQCVFFSCNVDSRHRVGRTALLVELHC